MNFQDSVQILTVVGIVLGIIAGIITIWRFHYYCQDRKPTFNNFERSKVNGQWKVFLHSPTKIIRKCSIEFNGKKLFVDDGKNYFKSIGAGGGGNFYLPKDVSDDDDHFVIVKDDRRTILKERFKDMYTVNG